MLINIPIYKHLEVEQTISLDNNISTLIYSPAGSRSASAIRISLKEGKKRYSLICSIKEKDKLKIHFKNFGLKLEDYYSSKVKLRKHIKY